MGNVNVIRAGKAKNVRYDMTNVKYQIVTVMGIVLTENVPASEGIKANFVKKSIVLIPPVQVMAFALKALVFVRKVGKVWIVERWIKMHYNVCRIALAMALSM